MTRLLNTDEARLAVWQAIEAITIGNATDDKLIVANLAKAGIYLATQPATSQEGEGNYRKISGSSIAATPQEEEAVDFRPMDTWDRRDETVMLLVDYRGVGDHPLEDANFAITVGHNNDHNVGEGEGRGWQFAGWCWTHDHYVEGKGKPVGWMPLPHHLVKGFSL